MSKKTNHIMIVLELLDKTPTAAIAAIGAVAFDPLTGDTAADFYCRVDIVSSQEHGGTIGADTVKWWLRQSRDAQAEIVCENAHSITEALTNFNLFILNHTEFDRVTLWEKGTDFDLPILTSAMQRCRIKPAWDFWRVRDVRTFLEAARLASITPLAYPFEGSSHLALYDAQHQADMVSVVWRRLAKMGTHDRIEM